MSNAGPINPNAPLLKHKTLGLNNAIKKYLSLLPGKPRAHGFHPSELYRLCPVLHYFVTKAREDVHSPNPALAGPAFQFLQSALNARRVSPESAFEVELGHPIHDIVKDKLGLIGVLWGEWTCPECDVLVPEGFMPRTHSPDVADRPILTAAPCRSCNGQNLTHPHAWKYVEPAMHRLSEAAKQLGIVGHQDGDLRINVDGIMYRFVLEIKSCKQEDIKGQVGVVLPKPEHIEQASVYAWLRDVKYIYFVYVNKNQCNDWREFIVPVNGPAVQNAINKIHATRNALAVGQPPLQARVCPDVREKRARECPAVEMCFGCKPPSNFMT